MNEEKKDLNLESMENSARTKTYKSSTEKSYSIIKLLAWPVGIVALIGLGIASSQISLVQNYLNQPGLGEIPGARSQTEAANNPFLKHAIDAGISSCSALYSRLGEVLTNGTDYMVQTQTAKSNANDHSLYGAVGMKFMSAVEGGYKGAASGIVFAAPVPGGCEGSLVRIVPFSQSCAIAATFLPANSQVLQPLNGLQFYRLDGGGQAILMPSGEGCTAISIIQAGS